MFFFKKYNHSAPPTSTFISAVYLVVDEKGDMHFEITRL